MCSSRTECYLHTMRAAILVLAPCIRMHAHINAQPVFIPFQINDSQAMLFSHGGNVNGTPGRWNMTVWASVDSGATWTPVVQVEPNGNTPLHTLHTAYSALLQLTPTTALVVWERGPMVSTLQTHLRESTPFFCFVVPIVQRTSQPECAMVSFSSLRHALLTAPPRAIRLFSCHPFVLVSSVRSRAIRCSVFISRAAATRATLTAPMWRESTSRCASGKSNSRPKI
jgi:hypothetical protein